MFTFIWNTLAFTFNILGMFIEQKNENYSDTKY